MSAAPAPPSSAPPQTLKRSLDLKDLVAFGIASIMGSGGFNLIGEAVREAGPTVPISLGLVAALFQGASKVYEEAYHAFKGNTAESDIVMSVFGSSAARLTSLLILGFNVFSVSTILVFAAKTIFPKGTWFGQISAALVLLVTMAATSLKGIELNKDIINTFSLIIVGLLGLAGVTGLVEGFGPTGTDVLAFPSVLSQPKNFVSSLLFFYFVLAGFDDNMKFSEEAVNPDTDIPKSFYISNALSALLTIGMAYAFIHVLTLKSYKTAPTENALGLVLESALGPPTAAWIHWISIVLMLVTAFVSYLTVTRYLYSLGERKEHKNCEGVLSRLLQWMKPLNEAQVPWRAVAVTTGLAGMGILMNHTHTLVRISDFFSISTLAMVSTAVAAYRWKKGETPWIEGATALGVLGIMTACCSPFQVSEG